MISTVTAILAISVIAFNTQVTNIFPVAKPAHSVCSVADKEKEDTLTEIDTYSTSAQNKCLSKQGITDEVCESSAYENTCNFETVETKEEIQDPNRLYINGVDMEVSKGSRMEFTDENGTEYNAKGIYYNGVRLCQECYGFAEWCQYKLYGNISLNGVDWFYRENSNNNFYRLTIDGVLDSAKGAPILTEESLKIIIQQAGVGSHLRTGGGHSVFITDITDEGFSIAQCNGIYNDEYEGYKNNYIGTHTFTWKEYVESSYADKGIHFVELHY